MLGSAIFNVFVITLGSAFMYAAVRQDNKRIFLSKSGLPANGVVIRLEQDNDPDSSIYYPVIQFITLRNETVTARHSFGSQPSFYRVGQKIQVLYDPLAPQEFVLGANGIEWEAYGFGLVGAILVSYGLYQCFESYL